MGEYRKTEETMREYLLGRVSDETALEGIEDLLFTDEEFCSTAALMEDSLINDYVLGRLDGRDAESFRATLAGNPERRFKLELTQALSEKALARRVRLMEERPSFFDSIEAFFSQPKYLGAFAVLLIAAVSLTLYFTGKSKPDQLAELRSIYQKARPTETRISKFGYAPLEQLRGAPEPGERNRLRRIENSLSEAAEKAPNARTHHALGVFYLTQQKYPEAIKEFASALKFNGEDGRIHNDLGAAHFELSKTGAKEKKFEELALSLEEFTKAAELDGNLLEALFNKSLALQEMRLPREAKESWELYLRKDPSSPWAEEARKNLARPESERSLFKTDEQVLTDFLIARRNHDDRRSQKIHDDTKGFLTGPAVPHQLSRRFLLARLHGNDAEAKESIEALNFIGSFEQARSGDLFFAELACYYAAVSPDKTGRLLEAGDAFASGQRLVKERDYARAILQFERSRDLFAGLGNTCDAAAAENWAVQFLPDTARVAEGRRRLAAAIAMAEGKGFKVLLSPAYYWLGMADYLQNEFSKSSKNLRAALRLADAGNNTFEIQHAREALVFNYSNLGELGPALSYASEMLDDTGLYYQNRNQWLRNTGTLAVLSLKLNLPSTSLSLSREKLSVVQESPTNKQLNDSLRYMVLAAAAKRDFAAALKYADDSMEIALKATDSPENARTLSDIHGLAGDVKSQTNDYGGALADYDRALELYSRTPELSVNLYRIHKGKLFCFQRLDDEANFAGEMETVLGLSEEYRKTIREDESRQAFFADEQDVFDAAIEHAIHRQDSRRAFALVETSKARSLLEFVQSGKSIIQVENDFASIAHPLSLEEIQSRLPGQAQFVQYAVLPDKLAIWVVSKTRFDLIEKQIAAVELKDKIETYQLSIAGKAAPSDIRQTGRELYELLVPPGLSPDKQLCLVPDKSLHQLSFAALISREGKYLLEDYALFHAPSASVLVLATENARMKEEIRDESLLSIGNPDFDREENPNLPDLRAAEDEAKAVAGDYQKSLELLGSGGTKENFLRDFGNVEVVHFAGHFVANRQFPGNSKLLFAGGDLRSSELGAYKLPMAKLVVLSACQTGFERYDKSEGAIGIARTLLALGAPLVVASQWQVDSEPTKDLMIAFHHNRKKRGMTSAESLRRAQLEVLGAEKTNAPFYWAAFSLFGGYANY